MMKQSVSDDLKQPLSGSVEDTRRAARRFFFFPFGVYIMRKSDASLKVFGNCIPSGRQLPRTPPHLPDVTRCLDFSNDEDCEEEPQQHMEAGAGAQHQDQYKHSTTFDVNTTERKTVFLCSGDTPDVDPCNSMLKGMKGYQLTPADLEFIKTIKEEKLRKKLEAELLEVQTSLKKEMMAFELTCASRDRARAELNKFPSCEELTEWIQVVSRLTDHPYPSLPSPDVNIKTLLNMVTEENVQKAMDKKKIELAQMKKMLANKRKEEAKERGWLEKQIATGQLKIQSLMSQLSDLTSELEQQEVEYKDVLMQIKAQEEMTVETKVEDASEESQEVKSPVKRPGKERKKVGESTAKMQDTTKTSKTAKGKRKEDEATEKSKQSVATSRGSQKKAGDSQESAQAARGRRKPPGTTQTAASRLKNQTKVKTVEAESTSQQVASSRGGRETAAAARDAAEEEPKSVGPRRSKRIASKK